MHDPSTVAFEIKSPVKRKNALFPEGYRKTWFTIWHEDPCRDGTDDSCGWFMRARHGDPKVLEKIIKRFKYDWDRQFTSDNSGKTYELGLFKTTTGLPNLTVHGIVLNLFFLAALEHFGSRKKSSRFCQQHLFEILLFGENPFDSARDGIVGVFGITKDRDERIRNFAGMIYSWILRKERPWWKEPRWHVHHWRIQWHWWQRLVRRWTQNCHLCGKPIRMNEVPTMTHQGYECQACQSKFKTEKLNEKDSYG